MTKRLLNTQRIVNLSANPATGSAGEIYYNTSSASLKYHNGTGWVDFSTGGGGGASVTVSDTAPGGSTGAMWFNSLNGKMYIYYDSYWVEIGSGSQGGAVSTDVALSNSWWMGV